MLVWEPGGKRHDSTAICSSSVITAALKFPLHLLQAPVNKLSFGTRCNTVFNPEIFFCFGFFLITKIMHLFISLAAETTLTPPSHSSALPCLMLGL